jgi:hypothetical protein
VIRIRHLTLPVGLSALVRRGPGSELEIFVSDALDPDSQRTAVRVALRSSRQAGWRAGLLPLPLALLPAVRSAWLRAVTKALRTHAVASTAAASMAVAAAAALIVALPHHHAPSSPGKLPGAARVHAAPGRTASASPRGSRSSRQVPRAPRALRLPPQQTSPAPVSPSAASPGSTSTAGRSSPSPRPTSSGQDIVTSLDPGTFAASHRR